MNIEFKSVFATTWQLYVKNWWQAIRSLFWIVMLPVMLVVTVVPLVLVGSLLTSGDISLALRLSDLTTSRIIPIFSFTCFAVIMLYLNWILKVVSRGSDGLPRWQYSPEWTSGVLTCVVLTVLSFATSGIDSLWWLFIQIGMMLLAAIALLEALVHGGNPLQVLLRTGKVITGYPLQSLIVCLMALAGIALGSLMIGLGVLLTVPLACMLGAVWFLKLRGVVAAPVVPTPIQASPALRSPYTAGR